MNRRAGHRGDAGTDTPTTSPCAREGRGAGGCRSRIGSGLPTPARSCSAAPGRSRIVARAGSTHFWSVGSDPAPASSRRDVMACARKRLLAGVGLLWAKVMTNPFGDGTGARLLPGPRGSVGCTPLFNAPATCCRRPRTPARRVALPRLGHFRTAARPGSARRMKPVRRRRARPRILEVTWRKSRSETATRLRHIVPCSNGASGEIGLTRSKDARRPNPAGVSRATRPFACERSANARSFVMSRTLLGRARRGIGARAG